MALSNMYNSSLDSKRTELEINIGRSDYVSANYGVVTSLPKVFTGFFATSYLLGKYGSFAGLYEDVSEALPAYETYTLHPGTIIVNSNANYPTGIFNTTGEEYGVYRYSPDQFLWDPEVVNLYTVDLQRDDFSLVGYSYPSIGENIVYNGAFKCYNYKGYENITIGWDTYTGILNKSLVVQGLPLNTPLALGDDLAGFPDIYVISNPNVVSTADEWVGDVKTIEVTYVYNEFTYTFSVDYDSDLDVLTSSDDNLTITSNTTIELKSFPENKGINGQGTLYFNLIATQ